MIWIWLKNCQAQVQVQVRWRWVFFVSNELKWPKLAIFGLFEGHRSPKMPFFTGIRPGSTSAHLNHEFLGWVPPSSSQKNGQLCVKWVEMAKIGNFWLFEGHRSPKMPFFTEMRPGSTSAHLNNRDLRQLWVTDVRNSRIQFVSYKSRSRPFFRKLMIALSI